MSAANISYANLLHSAAARLAHSRGCDTLSISPSSTADDSLCTCQRRADAIALRSLAARIEQLTASLPPMPDGYALTDVGAREFLPPNVCIEFAAFCAAGFPSTAPHALGGAPGATDQ